MKKMLKILVPVLVLAMLLQVPFALSASANTLSENSGFKFTVNEAADPASGNLEVKLFANTIATEQITTYSATLVINTQDFDILDSEGNVITDNYLVDSVAVGDDFPIEATGAGTAFADIESLSIVSYNSTTKELFIDIEAQSTVFPKFEGVVELATFYLQTKGGAAPEKDVNIRLMRPEEYRTNACPSPAITPGAISSRAYTFSATAADLVTNMELEINYVVAGSVEGATITTDNSNSAVTVTVSNDTLTFTGNTTGANAFLVEDVNPGTYSVKITAPGSLGYTFNNVVVSKGEKSSLPEFKMVFGDYNNNGVINIEDINNIITCASNHDAKATADVNGNGVVNIEDINIAIGNYNKTSAQMVSEWTAA